MSYSAILTMNEVNVDEGTIHELHRHGCEWLARCPSLRDYDNHIPYIVTFSSIESFIFVRDYLVSVGDPKFVGLWNKNGTQYGYKKTTSHQESESQDVITSSITRDESIADLLITFDSSMYISILADEVEYDENGIEISRNRPTEPKQASNWSGWSDRDLKSY